MAKSWLLTVAGLVCVATTGCEDNPDGFYKKAGPHQDLANGGYEAPVNDPYVRNGFKDNFNATSKQELCSGPVKQKRWAAMVNEPIRPPRMIAGLDLAGSDAWTGLDFRNAEQVNCQSKAVSGSDSSLTAAWGDANEVQVDYKLSNNTVESYVLNQGFRGTLDFASRPSDIDNATKPNPFGQHKYSIGVGRPVLRDGQTWELNWKKACDPARPDIMDCWEKQATEMFDALMYTYAPDLKSTQTSCIKAQTCLAKTYSTGEAVFGVRPLGVYMYVPTVLVPQPQPSTPGYMYGFYVKLMPFSASELFLKLDAEGPIATARDLGDREPKVTCTQKLGMHYGQFLDSCVDVLKEPAKNEYTKNKLLGGMNHTKEAFNFSIEGVNLDFLSSKIGDLKTVGDDWVPSAEDEAHELEIDIRASGEVRNEFSQDGKTFTMGGTGAIYREYARIVQEDIKKQMKEWPNSVRTPRGDANSADRCDAGWAVDGDKCVYKGFEIGDAACLMPDGANPATWKAASGCTGFEQFITPGDHFKAPNPGVAKVSVGARALGMGFKTALKAGDPVALFCADPSPNTTGKDTAEACNANSDCWSNHCSENKCEDVENYYYTRCDVEIGGLRSSLLDGSWQRVLQYLGGDNPLNVPPALRDRKYYFRLWAKALVKYLKAATLFPTDLNALPADACGPQIEGRHSCDPEPDHLIFDQVTNFSDHDNFEYIDRRFVNKELEPIKVQYDILINSSNQQEWKFSRRMTRGERALYTAMAGNDRNSPDWAPGGKEDNLRITNLLGSPIIANAGFRGSSTKPEKDAYYCATTLIDGKPDADCPNGPPKDSLTGEYMLDGYGKPILTKYRGVFTGTAFSMGTNHMQLVDAFPFIKSATVKIPNFPDAYNPGGGGSTAVGVPAPVTLLDWAPKTPANGIRIPINAQRDKFIPSFTASMSGASLDFNMDYELEDGNAMRIQGVQSDNYMGFLFLCQDPVTSDILAIEPYESTDEIMAWKLAHPGAFDACEIIVRPSAYDNRIPISIAAKKAGIVLNVGLGSGTGRITTVEFFDTSLL
jgi:hypothetical protein